MWFQSTVRISPPKVRQKRDIPLTLPTYLEFALDRIAASVLVQRANGLIVLGAVTFVRNARSSQRPGHRGLRFQPGDGTTISASREEAVAEVTQKDTCLAQVRGRGTLPSLGSANQGIDLSAVLRWQTNSAVQHGSFLSRRERIFALPSPKTKSPASDFHLKELSACCSPLIQRTHDPTSTALYNL